MVARAWCTLSFNKAMRGPMIQIASKLRYCYRLPLLCCLIKEHGFKFTPAVLKLTFSLLSHFPILIRHSSLSFSLSFSLWESGVTILNTAKVPRVSNHKDATIWCKRDFAWTWKTCHGCMYNIENMVIYLTQIDKSLKGGKLQ